MGGDRQTSARRSNGLARIVHNPTVCALASCPLENVIRPATTGGRPSRFFAGRYRRSKTQNAIGATARFFRRKKKLRPRMGSAFRPGEVYPPWRARQYGRARLLSSRTKPPTGSTLDRRSDRHGHRDADLTKVNNQSWSTTSSYPLVYEAAVSFGVRAPAENEQLC